MTPNQYRAWSAQAAGLTAAAARAATDPAVRTELLALSRDLGRWAGPTPIRPAQPVRRAAQIVASALGGSASGNRSSPDDGALLDAVESVVKIAQMHNTTRPAIAAVADVARNSQAQRIAYARRTLTPGYYRTDGGVVRVRRARAGHTYASTRTHGGTWKASAPWHLIAAAEGHRMTPTDVAHWEKTIKKEPGPTTAVPVQRVVAGQTHRRHQSQRRYS